jgi:hypothetical protein
MGKGKQKNPHAVALGRLGGTKRAETLTAAERKRIAHKAAKARMTTMTAEERRRVAMLGVEAKRKKRLEREGKQRKLDQTK